MAEAKKIQLYTDRECTVEAIPETSANCVTLSDGLDVESVLKHDLTAPTVIHEETSFKVGKGDIDVSTSVVDGETPKMVIKGQTYQNILPDPSLRNSMSNGKTMQKINEGYDSVNVIDGVGKSAILKGQTLVNLKPQTTIQYQIPLDGEIVDNGNIITFTAKREAGTNIQFKYQGDVSKTYTVKCKVTNNSSGELRLIEHTTKINAPLATIPANQIANINISFKPMQVALNMGILFYLNHGAERLSEEEFVIEDLVILDGDYANQDIPYFEGMQSVKMPVLTTIGKNLFNENLPLENGYIDGNGNKTSSALYEWINQEHFVDGGESLIISYKNRVGNATVRLAEYGETGFIKRTNLANNKAKITLTANTKRVILSVDKGTTYFEELQIEYGTVATIYESYKSNILSTPEDLELRGIGDVCDTVDCITGELVNNYGIITIDGDFVTSTNSIIIPDAIVDWTGSDSHIKADNLPTRIYNGSDSVTTLTLALHGGRVYFRGFTGTLDELKSHFNTTPTRFQYRLAEKSIKTVDLSSFGNWEKIVLDGSEEWTKSTSNNNYFVETKISLLANRLADVENNFCHNSNLTTTKVYTTNTNIGMYLPLQGGIRIRTEEILKGQSIEEFKRQLSQNPITVWYPTTTSQANSIKEMLSFSNGHIQLSSGVGEGEYSLIPSFDYEVPTSNSYHMDLMKANTTYTMKLSTGNGSLVAHNGQSIGYMVNRTFNSGQLPINNLFYTTGWVNDLMILEGDLTSKALPYFKGIKSAFENESKIEVLSTGKNLVNLDNAVLNSNYQKVVTKIENGFNIKFTYNPNNFSGWDNAIRLRVDVKPNTNYVLSLTKIVRKDPYQGITPLPTWISGYTWVRKGDGRDGSLTEGNLTNGLPTVMKFNSRDYNYVTLDICSTPLTPAQDGDFDIVDIQIEESSSATVCEPYKSNSTKIPLLSPLRSLPNGVYDELIIDRMKKKATLIQRVGYSVINSEFAKNGGNWGNTKDTDPCWGFHCGNYVQGSFKLNEHNSINDKLPIKRMATTGDPLMGYYQSNPHIAVRRLEVCNLTMAKEWLDRNPIDFYYQLATPVVAEIDLENFPLVYKDGHIFLNSEIAPVVEIAYNVNQTQQIQANNETLQRHELDILDLDNLIVSFVDCEYRLKLLAFNIQHDILGECK